MVWNQIHTVIYDQGKIEYVLGYLLPEADLLEDEIVTCGRLSVDGTLRLKLCLWCYQNSEVHFYEQDSREIR